MKFKILVLVLGLTLVAAACNRSETPANNNDQSNVQGQQQPAPTPTPAPTPSPTPTPNPTPTPTPSSDTTITITSSGFSPSTVTIKKGTKVIFVNQDSKLRWPASDPHPTHTDLPGFDPKAGIKVGATYSYTFDQVGRWKFHDHLNSGHRGTITVE